MNRMEAGPTLKIDPNQKLEFHWGRRKVEGMAGDTIATALFASGVRIFSRSLKYHRPRGLYSLDGESANCLLEVDGLPNVRSENTLLKPGMRVTPQNVTGNLDHDLWGFLDRFHWAMPAGFYYRKFHKPAKLWPFFQNRIRKMAGIGKFNPDWEPGRVEEQYLNADVCVLGGGPAGISAAIVAGEAGLRVVLLESRPNLGGFYDWRVAKDAENRPLYTRAHELTARLKGLDNVRIFPRAFVNGLWGDNQVTAFQVGGEDDSFSERYIEVRAKSVIAATGCIERPMLFENNDRPGVMQPGCALRLARSYGILPGKRAVFSVGDDLGLEAALDLASLGLEVASVADCRTDGYSEYLVDSLRSLGIPVLTGWSAVRVEGRKGVSAVELAGLNGPGSKRFEADLLAASAGATPLTGPLSLQKVKLVYDPHTHFFLPLGLPPGLHAAGRMLGFTAPEAVEASGILAGLAAAAECGVEADRERLTEVEGVLKKIPSANGAKLISPPSIRKPGAVFVCFDEDATLEHIEQAAATGFDAPELAKRYTAAGTGPGQYGISGHNLPLILADLNADTAEKPVPTTVRPPLVPTLFSTYAGAHHGDIFKRTPLHQSQEQAGGVFRRVGVWKRARYFSTDFSSKDEIRAVRENVGLIDVSTLGKFRILGPDAEKALNRVYVGDMTRIPTGRMKYSAMVNEDGCLVDDGVVTRTGENDYYLTTSTGRAGMTIEWFRYHSRYDGWDYSMVNLTDTLGAINVAGPNARAVLQKLTDEDVSADAFEYLGYREIELTGLTRVRVMRLGFVGELSYEIHVPASYMQTVWDRLIQAGQEYDIRPFGLEAQNVLRLEKGHVIIGQESEIRTNLHDLGLGFLWHKDKPEAKTVGAPSLRFSQGQQGRLKLVGIEMIQPDQTPGDGSLVVDDAIRGHICTIRYSHTLGKSIGLALVDDELSQLGTPLEIYRVDHDDRWQAKVVSTPFYDPEGIRLRM